MSPETSPPKVPIGQLCELQNGRAFKPSEWGSRGAPIIRIQNLNDSTKPFNYFSGNLPARFRVRAGDVLLSWSGTPGTSFGCFRWSGPDGWLNQHIFNVRLNEQRILPEYFVYHVNAILGQLIAEAHGGVGLRHITKGRLDRIELSVPSIEKQRRIVGLLASAENLVRMRREAEHKANEIIPALFLDMFGDPTTNSKGWRIATLGNEAEVVSGVAKGRKLHGKATRNVPYLRVANVQAGHLDLAELKTIDATPGEIVELTLRTGDVLLTEGGDHDKLGRGALLERDIGECIHQNHVFRVRTNRPTLIPEYFASFLQTDPARAYFLKSAKKTTNLASINMTQLRALPVIVPPVSEQRSFQSRFAACRSLEADQAHGATLAKQTFQSLLARVFAES
jgi:type I restriction enzyme S subunit